jgi:acetyl-CoA acyltransferase
VRELVERSEVDAAWVDTVVMGQVIPSVKAPNLAREVGLRAGSAGGARPCREPRLRLRQRGHRGGGPEIRAGHAQVGIAGGARACPTPHPAQQADGGALAEASRARRSATASGLRRPAAA